jgi:hypothetical protein
MRGKIAVWLQSSLLLSIFFCAHSLFGQGYVGGDIGLGIASTPANTNHQNGTLVIPLGVFYDRTIRKTTAGLDLRVFGSGQFDFGGWAVGPRFTYPIGRKAPIIPYAEFLLGSGGMDQGVWPPSGMGPITYTHVGGMIVGTAIGVDLMRSQYTGLRLNYDYGQAKGNVNTTYSSVSIGFVFHIKTK